MLFKIAMFTLLICLSLACYDFWVLEFSEQKCQLNLHDFFKMNKWMTMPWLFQSSIVSQRQCLLESIISFGNRNKYEESCIAWNIMNIHSFFIAKFWKKLISFIRISAITFFRSIKDFSKIEVSIVLQSMILDNGCNFQEKMRLRRVWAHMFECQPL